MTITHSRQPAQLVEKHHAGWTSVTEQLLSFIETTN
jgi:hypothetical protein